MDPEVAVQLLSPSESVKYCARLDEPYYPKAFSKLMLKSTVDTLCDLYKSRRYGFDRQAAEAMRDFCDSKDKETETTVSRKTLHVPEVAEDDKDLEY